MRPRTASALTLLLLAGTPSFAQTSRTMRFLSGGLENQLDVGVEYADPYSVDPRLAGSLVLPMEFTVRNVSARPLAFNAAQLRLNLGGNQALTPVTPDAAAQEVFTTKRVPAILGFLTKNFSGFLPGQIAAVLNARQLKDGDVQPGQAKSGLVFFVRPAGKDPSTQTGVMWLEASGRPPQMLETKDVKVATRAPDKISFTEKLRQKWNSVFGAPPSFERSYALLIGVGNYKHLAPLDWPASDVKKMKAYLEAQGFDEVVTPSEDNVTIDKLRQPQKYFTSKLGPKDRFLFYYSGHGMEEMVGKKIRGFLPMTNEVPGGHQSSIPMDSLVAWMRGLKVEHLLVILDTCFSGLATDGAVLQEYAIRPADPKIDRDALNRLSRGSAKYLLTAGNKGQESFAGPIWKGSMFTQTLLRGLERDADPYHNRIVTSRGLYVWLLNAVFQEAQRVHRELTPLFVDLSPTGSDGDFVFVQ